MTNKAPKIDPLNQGSFLNEEVVHTGATDPDQQRTEVHLDVAPEGTYPDPVVPGPTTSEGELSDTVRDAVKTDHRHTGQLGKHSPLERSGSYSEGLKAGDFLPGFGPVTYSNIDAARQYAADLDSKRS